MEFLFGLLGVAIVGIGLFGGWAIVFFLCNKLSPYEYGMDGIFGWAIFWGVYMTSMFLWPVIYGVGVLWVIHVLGLMPS